MARIYLVRHGQASLLEDDYDRLSPLGETQSRQVGAWLGARIAPPQAIVCGTLKRQLQTAAACIEGADWTAPAASVYQGFDEHDHDKLIVQAFPQFADRAALAAWLRASEHPRRAYHSLFERAFDGWLRGEAQSEDGLTWAQFRQRCMAALQRVADACGPGQSAVVVTSGGPIAAICQALIGLPDERVASLHMPLFNASITQLLTRPGQISLSTFNSIAHLELRPDAPSLVTYR
jgi:broad specificity phosphatase PhoE